MLIAMVGVGLHADHSPRRYCIAGDIEPTLRCHSLQKRRYRSVNAKTFLANTIQIGKLFQLLEGKGFHRIWESFTQLFTQFSLSLGILCEFPRSEHCGRRSGV